MSDTTTNEPTSTIPYGYCQCGCGQKTSIASQTSTKHGRIKGQPVRFIHGHNGVYARSLCSETKLPAGTKSISLTRNKVAIVDAENYSYLNQWHWHATQSGRTWYARRVERLPEGKQRSISMHRAIMDAPDHVEVDHIDGDGLNNTRNNLRLATRNQNQHNRPLLSSNTSGFKGVSWCKQERKWRAQIKVSGKNIRIGVYDTPEDAARAYDKAARKLHGKFARLNFE